MDFISDPPISVKIAKMKQRVRWQDAAIVERRIDQTQLVLEDGNADNPEFSFLVIGDSGAGAHRGQNPQRQIAEQMLLHPDCRFILHTGDVVYLVGSSEFYGKNFIEPYREFLVGGTNPQAISFDRMVFTTPFFPVPGNHDYYDLPPIYGLLAQATLPLRRLFQNRLDLDVGWHGSFQGKAYTCAFIDHLRTIASNEALIAHLEQHYTGETETGRCLRYQPGQFTRLPNRYYSFRYGGIDFFALDSNTFNGPIPLPNTREGGSYRRQLEQRRADLQQQQSEILANSTRLNPERPEQAEELHDLRSKLEQLEELQLDIEKQLQADATSVNDTEQLTWLQERLITSWQDGVRGRVLFFHHPPYVTEATKWHQGQTLAVRARLRQVLNHVARSLGPITAGRPIVDLVLNGHAHCLEHLQTLETGHADRHTHWIVCGGSGYSLRRQRQEGPQLQEVDASGREQIVARSQVFVGRTGHGSQRRRPYSFLRIDVQPGCPPQFIVRPFIVERSRSQWQPGKLDPWLISG